jgi:hypothetical protein
MKLLRNMVSYTTPPPPSHTLYFDTGKGGRCTREKVEGAIVHIAWLKTPT